MLNLTSHQLRQAADLQDQIAALKQQLAGLLSFDPGTGIPAPFKAAKRGRPQKLATPALPVKPGKRTMSPAHKAKIRAAQAIRWAKYNEAKGKPAPEVAKPEPKKGGMSAAGKARIIAAQKARWAKYNAAKPAPEPVKKRKMSAAGRAAIIAAVKARWAKVKAAKK